MSRLTILDLAGDFRRRGEQHGEAVAAKVRETGIVEFYHEYCARELPLSKGALTALFVRVMHELCAGRLSPDARAALKGFARASGFNERVLARALVMPDVLNFLIGFGARLAQLSPSLGCTSVAVWGRYTKGGRFLYGRNLDFPGNGYFDRYPLLLRHKPDKGIPYVSVGTAGNILDGVTGLNQEGLSVALHQHISSDSTPSGKPIMDLAVHILQFARSIEEAIDWCARWKTTSAWTVVLTHAPKRRAAAVELAPSGMSVQFFTDGRMVRANDYEDARLKRNELDFPVWRESSRARHFRAEELVEAKQGHLDVAAVASILGDHTDSDRRAVRAFAQTIAQPHNMCSVVFDPDHGELWLSEGAAPVCRGPYRRIPLWGGAPGDLLEMPDPLPAAKRKGFESYLGAFTAWQRRRDEPAVCASLDESLAADPQEPAYRYMRGLFALRQAQWDVAERHLAEGAALPDYGHRSSAQRLWQARALDLAGKRAQAQGLYRDLAGRPLKPALKRAAEEGLAKPYEPRRVRQSVPDFNFADVYKY